MVVKVSTSLNGYPTPSRRELKIYKHLATVDSSHPGQAFIRKIYDAFQLDSVRGKHQCLVQQPMLMSVREMITLNPKLFNLQLLKTTLKRLLSALDYLHTDAKVVHTGT